MVIKRKYIWCQLPNWKPDSTAEVGTRCSLTHPNSQLWSHAASWPLCCHCHIRVMFQAMQCLFRKANSWYSVVLSPQKLYCRAICMWKSVGQVILWLVCCDEACKLIFWMHFCKGLKVSGSSSDRWCCFVTQLSKLTTVLTVGFHRRGYFALNESSVSRSFRQWKNIYPFRLGSRCNISGVFQVTRDWSLQIM